MPLPHGRGSKIHRTQIEKGIGPGRESVVLCRSFPVEQSIMDVEQERVAKSVSVRSEIHLEIRAGDKLLGTSELRQFDLFRRMKKPISIEKIPGSIVLRGYHRGDVVFQQGRAGGTAFYIPTAEDLVRLHAVESGQEPPADPKVDPGRNRQILSAMIIPSTTRPRPAGLFGNWFPSLKKDSTPQLASIPSDGPSDIDYETREAPLMEGDLFGEMSCISYMPRSATVVVQADCHLLEFNRNVFDQLRGDVNHQASVEEHYRRRTLDTHLRQFEMFRDLTESQIQLLKENVSLEVAPPGKVICEEGEQWSDSNPLDVFIVRNGVVQVIVNANLSVRLDDVRDWTALCLQLDKSLPDPKKREPDGTPVPVVQQTVPQPLSPLERMRQQKAGTQEAGKVDDPATGPVIPPASTSTADQPVAPNSEPVKLSPLEQIRAKQAAAKQRVPAAQPTDLVIASAGEGKPADQVVVPAKLSPLEQIRAKQAAAARPAATPTEPAVELRVNVNVDVPADQTAVPTKLSPLEQIRAKQAAAATQTTPGTKPTDQPAAVPPAKLSPIEQMRAKQSAAAAIKMNAPVIGSPESASDSTVGAKLPIAPSAEQEASNQAATVPNPPAVDGTRHNVISPPRLRKPKSDVSGPPTCMVKSWLNDHVQQAVHQVASGELQGDAILAAQTLVLEALNELLGNPDFLSDKRLVADIYTKPEIMRKTASFPKGFKGIGKDWSELELRTTGRAALSEIFPNLIRRPSESSGPPRVLAYLSRGDCIGEIVVVKRGNRNATCIAYNHPSSENPRDFGNVELVRIRGSAFQKLMSESPQLKQKVEALAEKRLSQVQSLEGRHTEPDLVASTEFQQMGLFQGTKLLVIDLDSCTRCGDCVQACVATHDDGATRLFLDGPRYDRFLVPSACRSCLNPVCMIGCPVGSIGRGENGQIEIYDWCIGCSACADQCPYDSIQMHDVGLIPEESSGWLYGNRRSLPDDWFGSRRISAGWMQGNSPFRWQGEFLKQWSPADLSSQDAQSLQLCFRHEFRLPKKAHSQTYRISINDERRKGGIEKVRVKKSKVVGVWLNGKKLEWSGNSMDLAADQFARANNLLSIEVSLESSADYGQFVLSACLDAIPEVGNRTLEVMGKEVRIEMDLVTRRATVCDMCSHIPSQQPACVSSCPHDAAIRINPLINFPV